MIDSSSSIWVGDFMQAVHFLQNLVKRFRIGPDATRIAALTFSDNAIVEFYFNDVESIREAEEWVNSFQFRLYDTGPWYVYCEIDTEANQKNLMVESL